MVRLFIVAIATFGSWMACKLLPETFHNDLFHLGQHGVSLATLLVIGVAVLSWRVSK